MDSITEVLAQAVYNLHLHDLPLDNLALDQRKRTASMGRRPLTARQDLSLANLSNFPVITEGPPLKVVNQGAVSRSPSKDQVDGGASRPLRGPLVRSSTQDEEGSPRVEVPMVKRHSTPITTGSRPSVASALAPISEFDSPDHPQLSTEAAESTEVVTPYQPLVEEDLSSGGLTEEEEEGGGAVITNINAQSPSPTHEDAGTLTSSVIGPRPHSAPCRKDIGEANLESPIPSQSSLNAGSPTPSQEGVKQRGKSGGGEGQKKLLPGNIFKHRSKGRGLDNRVTPKQNSLGSPVEERRKKRKWFHKRSGSDSVMTMTNPVVGSDRETELSVASDRSSPILGASEKRQSFNIHRSSSDGNIHSLLQYGHASPDTGPEPVSVNDSGAGIPFRRVTTIASPTAQEPLVIGGGSVSGSHRPLRRSLTMDSPEPTPTGKGSCWGAILCTCVTASGLASSQALPQPFTG